MSKIELKVNSMKCMGCASTVQTNLSKLLGVENVETYLDTKSVTVTYNGNPDVLNQIYKTLESIGFSANK